MTSPYFSTYPVHQQQWQQGPPPPSLLGPGDVVLFDETMNQPIMREGMSSLLDQGHSIVPLSVAYRTRLAALQAEISGALMIRRDALLRRTRSVQARTDELRMVRSSLERDCHALVETMLERLRTAEATKLAMLQREREEALRGVEDIQLLMDEAAAAAASPDMLAFLQHCPALLDRCRRWIARPVSEEVTISAAGFESEAGVYADLAHRYGALQKLLGLKDAMIWELLEIRAKAHAEAQEAREAQAAERARAESALSEVSALKSRVAELERQVSAQAQAFSRAPDGAQKPSTSARIISAPRSPVLDAPKPIEDNGARDSLERMFEQLETSTSPRAPEGGLDHRTTPRRLSDSSSVLERTGTGAVNPAAGGPGAAAQGLDVARQQSPKPQPTIRSTSTAAAGSLNFELEVQESDPAMAAAAAAHDQSADSERSSG